MFKLLLENQKKLIWKEYRARRTVVFLIFLLITGLIIFILIIPAYYFSGSRNVSLEAITKNLEKSISEKEQSSSSKNLRDLNVKLTALMPDNKVAIDEIIDSLIGGVVNDIKIKSFVYSELPDDVQGIVMTGVAKNRDSIVTFVSKINNTKGVISADVPISDFVKDTDIPFTINISGKFLK